MSSIEVTFLAATVVLLGPTCLVALLNLVGWRPLRLRTPDDSMQVSVLIPARNEEENIEDCVRAVLDQGAVVSEVLIYNDGSSDGTQFVIDRLIQADAERVRQVATKSLATGWVGKPHACARLAEEASAPWMLFLDADARLERNGVRNLLGTARSTSASLVSAWPALEMSSFAERLLMPLLNFVVFTLFPAPIARWRRGASLGLAHGACILVERDAYQKTGGHELVRDRLFEDTALARAWREQGENSQVVDGRGTVSVRMYSDFAGIWRGFSKNYYPAFSRSASFFLFQAYMAAAYLALPVLAIAAASIGSAPPWIAGLAAITFVPRLFVGLCFRHPAWSVVLHPIAVSLMIALGFRSWWSSTLGGGVRWKGRTYNAAGLVVEDE